MNTTPKKLRLNQETITNLSASGKNFAISQFTCVGGPHCELTNAINCFTHACPVK